MGAPAGTTVYAPVYGLVVAIQPRVLNGSTSTAASSRSARRGAGGADHAARAPAADAVQVGGQVTASRTKLGTVVDLSHVIYQTVAKYTSDAGNHVAVSLARAPGASPLL